MLIAVLAVYNEEELLPAALESLRAAGADRIHVFDGAWRGGKDGAHAFGEGTRHSTDETLKVAARLGAIVHTGPADLWPSQESKRTAMFQRVGARDGEVIFVMDADETLEGRFSEMLPLQPAHIMVRCVGGNDLPGIRGVWPNGDYCEDFKPELRLFPWSSDLECVYPGGYWWNGELIQPYADSKGRPALPVLDGITMDHHGAARSPERIEQKIAYYQAEHPERLKWQRAFSRA